MSLKKVELANPNSCLNKATPDEPVFVLRAKDPFAAQTVRLWATMADGAHEPDKVLEALKLAAEMEEWRDARMPKVNVTLGCEPGEPITRAATSGYADTPRDPRR